MTHDNDAYSERTKGGLLVWQLLPTEMPAPMEPLPADGALMAV